MYSQEARANGDLTSLIYYKSTVSKLFYKGILIYKQVNRKEKQSVRIHLHKWETTHAFLIEFKERDTIFQIYQIIKKTYG